MVCHGRHGVEDANRCEAGVPQCMHVNEEAQGRVG